MSKKQTILAALTLIFSAIFTGSAYAQSQTHCDSKQGNRNGYFYTWFEASSASTSGCKTRLEVGGSKRHFATFWDMEKEWTEDAVGGMGWTNGGDTRKFGYQVKSLSSNSKLQKALVAIYGWSCNGSSIEEYYVVDTWAGGGQFVPWDENANNPAKSLTTVSANGATYDVYKVGRNGPHGCGSGNKSFDQYWSVRRGANGIKKNKKIDFGPHVNKWDNYGFDKSGLPNGYVVLASESFGDANVEHKGSMGAVVWWRGGN